MHPSWSHLLNILTSFLWSLRVQTIGNTCRLVKLSGRITRAGRGKGGWSQGARHFNLHFRDPESTLSVSPGKRELRNHARQRKMYFTLVGIESTTLRIFCRRNDYVRGREWRVIKVVNLIPKSGWSNAEVVGSISTEFQRFFPFPLVLPYSLSYGQRSVRFLGHPSHFNLHIRGEVRHFILIRYIC